MLTGLPSRLSRLRSVVNNIIVNNQRDVLFYLKEDNFSNGNQATVPAAQGGVGNW